MEISPIRAKISDFFSSKSITFEKRILMRFFLNFFRFCINKKLPFSKRAEVLQLNSLSSIELVQGTASSNSLLRRRYRVLTTTGR